MVGIRIGEVGAGQNLSRIRQVIQVVVAISVVDPISERIGLVRIIAAVADHQLELDAVWNSIAVGIGLAHRRKVPRVRAGEELSVGALDETLNGRSITARRQVSGKRKNESEAVRVVAERAVRKNGFVNDGRPISIAILRHSESGYGDHCRRQLLQLQWPIEVRLQLGDFGDVVLVRRPESDRSRRLNPRQPQNAIDQTLDIGVIHVPIPIQIGVSDQHLGQLSRSPRERAFDVVDQQSQVKGGQLAVAIQIAGRSAVGGPSREWNEAKYCGGQDSFRPRPRGWTRSKLWAAGHGVLGGCAYPTT